MQHPVWNLIIAMMGGDGKPPMLVNLTIPDPGATRLKDSLAGIGPHSDSESIKNALKTGVAQIDTAVANEPTPPIQVPPKGKPLIQVYRDELIDIAEGRRVVLAYEGDPLIVSAEEAADIDAGTKHIYRDLETGALEVREGDGKATDIDNPETSTSAGVEDGAGQGMPGADPLTDGSASGEKHSEGAPQV